MSWGTRRRNLIVFVFALIILIPVSIIAFNTYYTPPNCFDGFMNGEEEGLDCGGKCALICDADIIDPIVVWKRAFSVSPGVYNVVAYVENPNADSGVRDAQYVFRLYDTENVLLYERKGSTSIRPKEILPIVENTLFTDQLLADRVTFEFTNQLIFEKEENFEPIIIVEDEEITEVEISPRIDAKLRNTSLLPVRDIFIVAIIYDGQDNAIASSSTVIEKIDKDQSVPIVFTWPVPFSSEVARIELIPIYNK
jgi:hypothetical protein